MPRLTIQKSAALSANLPQIFRIVSLGYPTFLFKYHLTKPYHPFFREFSEYCIFLSFFCTMLGFYSDHIDPKIRKTYYLK